MITNRDREEYPDGFFELNGREYEDFMVTHAEVIRRSVSNGSNFHLVGTAKYPTLFPATNCNCGWYWGWRDCVPSSPGNWGGGYSVR